MHHTFDSTNYSWTWGGIGNQYVISFGSGLLSDTVKVLFRREIMLTNVNLFLIQLWLWSIIYMILFYLTNQQVVFIEAITAYQLVYNIISQVTVEFNLNVSEWYVSLCLELQFVVLWFRLTLCLDLLLFILLVGLTLALL